MRDYDIETGLAEYVADNRWDPPGPWPDTGPGFEAWSDEPDVYDDGSISQTGGSEDYLIGDTEPTERRWRNATLGFALAAVLLCLVSPAGADDARPTFASLSEYLGDAPKKLAGAGRWLRSEECLTERVYVDIQAHALWSEIEHYRARVPRKKNGGLLRIRVPQGAYAEYSRLSRQFRKMYQGARFRVPATCRYVWKARE